MNAIGRDRSDPNSWFRRAGLATLLLSLALLIVASPAWAQVKSITLSTVAGLKEDVIRAILPEFEKSTGIKVALDVSPYMDLYKKQLLALSTGGRYDVMLMDEPWIPALSGFLTPLEERMKAVDMQDFVPTTVEAGAFQGTQYGLPVDCNVQILAYRKDLFAQKGLLPPATWDDLLAVAKAFHDPAKQQYGIAITAGSASADQTTNYLMLLMWSYGAELIDNQGRASVNSEAGRKGAAVYLELLKVAPPAVRSYSFADVTKAVQLGQAAMAIQWASGIRPMEDPTRSSVVGKLGYTLVPKGTRQTPMRGVWVIGIAKSSANQDAAWEFVKWLTSREFGLAAAKYPTMISAVHSPRVSVLQDPGTQAVIPYANTVLDSLRVAKAKPRLKEYPDIEQHLWMTAPRLAVGELSVEAALKEIDAGINKALGK